MNNLIPWSELKKVLVNAYFAQNLGDDLFLKVLVERYPDVTFHLLTGNQKYNDIFRNHKNVKALKSLNVRFCGRTMNVFSKVQDNVFKYKNYDALIIIGGSIFMETPNWKKGLKKREYLPKMFKKINRKVFIIGANFGPYTDEQYVYDHTEFFINFDDICFRDSFSYDLFSRLKNIRIAPDVVFSLKRNLSHRREKCVGISVIDIKNRNGLKKYARFYIEKMTAIIKSYINKGYKVKLFSFCDTEGDIRAIYDILNKLEPSYIDETKVVRYSTEINQFLNEYESCETIIGTRFHSIILGLLFNQNVFPVIYSDKTYNVLKDLNMEKECCFIKNINQLDVDSVSTKIFSNKFNNLNTLKASERQFEKLDILLAS